MSESAAASLNWAFLLGLVALIFFIWRSFSRLAKHHHKEDWFYGLLGICIFFTGIYMGGLIEPILEQHIISGSLRLPLGILTCWLVYRFLKKSWAKKDQDIK